MGDLTYLRNWIAELRHRVNVLAGRHSETGKRIVFTISTTSKYDEKYKPYLTPLRETSKELISGVIVRSLDQGAISVLILDVPGVLILVDAEGKKGLIAHQDPQLYSELGLDSPQDRLGESMSNLVSLCKALVKRAELRLFKPNDLTVESVWYFVEAKLKKSDLVAIIGGGNIGFKLGLKLAESGCRVVINRRNHQLGKRLVLAFSELLPPLSTGTITYEKDPDSACKDAAFVVGTTDGIPAITEKMVVQSKIDAIFLDVGKGTLFPEAIQACHQTGREVYRTDISSGLEGFLAGLTKNDYITRNELGRREIASGLFVISGGYLGELGDLIVDNFMNPKMVIGVADGMGDLIRSYSDEQAQSIDLLRGLILARKC